MSYFIIYDFETTGRSARFDQILQAGFVCFDENFNELKRLNLKSRINPDVVPSFGALKVNQLLISDLLEEKISSYYMIKELNEFLSFFKPAIFLGYNSINFDEEFLRQALWELFKYPYITSSRENSRGDVLNLVTMTNAFNPQVLNVEENDEGKKVFKLESLASVNNFNVTNSHEAISDVLATKDLIKLIKNNEPTVYKNFLQNTNKSKLVKKITQNKFFTIHGYFFSRHYISLATNLFEHPVYENYFLAFDLKYDPEEIIFLQKDYLRDIYYTKKLNGKTFNCFKKLKLNKHPSILEADLSINQKPYADIGYEELEERRKKLSNEEFINNLKKIIISESESYENFSEHEEETIYSENLAFQDKIIMDDFEKVDWSKKWKFATKFKDPRLQFFAAKHIYRNFPESLPQNIFRRVHQKIATRFNSLKKEKFTTIPSAMEEADNFSFESENNEVSHFQKKQLEQYNIYINFLNDYYNNPNATPIKFDKDLSKRLFY